MKKEVVLSLILIALFFFYNILGISGLFYAGIIILFVLAFLINVESCMLIGLMLVPHIMMIKFEDSTQAFLGFFFMIFQLKYILINKKKFSIYFILYPLAVIICALMHNQFSLVSQAVRGVIFLMFCFSAKKLLVEERYQEKLFLAYIIGCLTCVITAAYSVLTNGIDLLGGQFTAIGNDRNFYGITLATGICCCLVMSFRNSRLLYCMLAILLAAGGVLSGSRTFFISLLIAALMFTGQSLTGIAKMKQSSIVVSILFILLFFVLLPTITPIIDDLVLNRFDDDNVETGGGRIISWQYYIKEWKSSINTILFGIGNSSEYVKSYRFDIVEHNTYLQALCSYGLIGGCLLLCFYISTAKNLLSRTIKRGRYLWSYIPLLIFLVGHMTINDLHGTVFDSCFLLSILSIDYSTYSTKIVNYGT